ncbi:hypothetical protein GTA28_06195 [Rhodococcus hoagii]|nr:hypothetical protein [Prescottella equi]
MEFDIYSFQTTQRWNPLGELSLSVQQASTATSTTVTVPPSAKTGESIQLSASISPVNATGTVQFKDGTANIGAPIPVVNGIASTSHTFATAGSKPITATFAGSGGFSNSTSAGRIVDVSVRGQDDVESNTIMTAPQSATVGVAVCLSAQVSSTALTLPGTVQFYDRGSPIGPRLPVANGVVALDYVFDSAGAHEISAAYTVAWESTGRRPLPRPSRLPMPRQSRVRPAAWVTEVRCSVPDRQSNRGPHVPRESLDLRLRVTATPRGGRSSPRPSTANCGSRRPPRSRPATGSASPQPSTAPR